MKKKAWDFQQEVALLEADPLKRAEPLDVPDFSVMGLKFFSDMVT